VHGVPSVEAWIALVTLLGVVGLGMVVRAPRTRTRTSGAVVPEWVLPVVVGVAHVPAVLAWLLDAPWPTVAWWLLLAPPASVAVLGVGGSAVLVSRRWPTWRRQLAADEKRAVTLVAGLTVAAAVAVPGVLSVVLALDGDLRRAAAWALVAGYVAWRLTLAFVRRSPVFAVDAAP